MFAEVRRDEIPDTLVTTYLEMTDREQFRPSLSNRTDVYVQQMQTPDVDFYRFLYGAVGEKWRWRDRLVISRSELLAELNRAEVSVYVLYVGGTPAGYVELCDRDGEVEVAYFGLREQFFGQGLGKHLLSYGIGRAWDRGAYRVWLHTCNLDGPHALSNYQRRGFRVYQRTVEPMPERYV